MDTSPRIWVLRCTIETQFEAPADALRFRLDQFVSGTDPGTYRFRVFRYDLFQFTPLGGGESAHHDALVVDPTFDGTELQASSGDEALQAMLQRMTQHLSV